jgi:DNA-binding transcriptional LysR family regulator
MEFRHLRHFVVVADELSFRRAADRIGMEKSTPSHSIKTLEHCLGVTLVERVRRSTRLTTAGNDPTASQKSVSGQERLRSEFRPF